MGVRDGWVVIFVSRSYKKSPVCNIVKPDGSYKAIFNRRIRRKHLLDVPSGNSYRKLNESWYIHDWRSWCGTFEQYSVRYRQCHDDEPSYSDYKRWYLSK